MEAWKQKVVFIAIALLVSGCVRQDPKEILVDYELSQIKARESWAPKFSHKNIPVAVLDTGIDRTNKFQLLQSAISDASYDFVAGVPVMTDENGHGTHISGLIEKVSNHRAKIIALRYYSDRQTGEENLRKEVDAFYYAEKLGVRVINLSGGGPYPSPEEAKALEKAAKLGIVVVAAAGNERSNQDTTKEPYYPASYHFDNVITVASVDETGTLSRFSNYGSHTIDVAAPGENLVSALPGGVGIMSGTSQATAVVTGVVVAMLSVNPKLTPIQIKSILTNTADKTKSGGRMVIGGVIDAEKAVKEAKNLMVPN